MANLLTKEEFLSLLRKNRKPNEIESSEEEIVKVKKTRVKGTLKKEKTKENNTQEEIPIKPIISNQFQRLNFF